MKYYTLVIFLLQLSLESILGDKEILTVVPVQHKKHPIALRSSSEVNVDKTEGPFGHMINGRDLYDDSQDDSVGSEYIIDPDNLQVYEEDISKRRIGSAKNVRYGTWKYNSRNRIPGRGKRSVSIGNEPSNYDIDADQYRSDEEKRRIGSALNVRYGTWQYNQPVTSRSDSRFKRFKNHQKQKSGGRVMHRWQSIWGSPGKRNSEDEDTEEMIDYLLRNGYEIDENLIEDKFDVKDEAKRPMGVGPYMNWGNYFHESKRPMGMGPSVNWANYEYKRPKGIGPNLKWANYESKRPMGMGPHMNWANYFQESKRPMGIGPHTTYFKASKRPMGMGPLTNWAKYYQDKRDYEDIKEESKRPMGMGPYMKWSKYFQNKRDSGNYKEEFKRPMGMGPSVNWARYYTKRNSHLDDSGLIYKEESKRPMGVGPYMKWWKFFS